MELFPEGFFDEPGKKKKKADVEALSSPFMRIPRLPVDAARDLLDLGFLQTYEIAGRSPETLYAEICKKRPDTPPDRLAAFRLAVYVAENPNPDKNKLYLTAWV
jgi:hypothetical protein